MIFLSKLEVLASRKSRYLEFLKDLPYNDSQKKGIVEDAIKSFEREDRIMWFLRKARGSDLIELYLMSPEDLEKHREHLGNLDRDKMKKKIEKLIKAPPDSIQGQEKMHAILEEGKKLGEMLRDIKHYLSNARLHKLDSVLKYSFPIDAPASIVFSRLKALEQEELARRPSERFIKQDDEQKTFIEFPNKWKWIKLEKESCELEGKAMKHCGNTASPKSGDNILSLREPIEVELKGKKKKEIYWKPHATFILNKGILGEMKGFLNAKPGKDLHPYIIKLLEDPRIKGIKGGGHNPRNNFSLGDLPPKVRKKLLTKKPKLDQEGSHEGDLDDGED